ncbi:MAG: sigma 54-interacting transcriptional regulator [Deltaproteobacteria bacterium]|nr:sigma 54-interacting transcriptional regulator [Deltaproteobacteria bacterium]
MPVRIQLAVPSLPVRLFETAAPSISLGRGAGNMLMMDNPHVSTHHGRIDVTGSGVTFTDLGSTNGSMILRADQRLPAPGGGPAVPLKVGDKVVMGDSSEPVVATLLDDGKGGAVHPSKDDAPVVTSVASRPVDPDAGGTVVARFSVENIAVLPEGLSRDARVATAVFDLARSAATEDLTSVVDRAASTLFTLCAPASHLFLGVLEADKNDFRRTLYRARGRTGDQPGWRVSRALVARVITRREACLVSDAAVEMASSESVALSKIRSAITVPLWRGGEVWGILSVDTREGGVPFTERDLELVTVLASLVTLALVNADIMGKLRARGEALEGENRYLQDALRRAGRFTEIIGKSPAMQGVFEQLTKVARTDATVLIEGETGTGKELVARALHNQSPRKDRIFLGTNCGSLTDTLLESELFGHVRGAFTGATQDKKGLFTIADGGTIFLDEIGETSPAMQQRLLRVLQESEVRPVGATRSHKVTVRVISATNRDLEAEVKEGRFREDLLYRLKVVPVRLPPLRERGDDIALLAEHFLAHYSGELERGSLHFSSDAMSQLRNYPWPGNIRELQNEMQRVAIQADPDQEITAKDLSAKVTGAARLVPQVPDSEKGSLKELLDAVEAQILRDRLSATGNNVTRAAETLGLTREGLHKKLKRFGLR